jgi:hypothetical protein
VEEYTREVAEAGAREAVQQFTTFDWSRMNKLGLSLVRAVAAAASAAAAAVAAAGAAANVAAAAAAAGASGAAALLLQRLLACLPGSPHLAPKEHQGSEPQQSLVRAWPAGQ